MVTISRSKSALFSWAMMIGLGLLASSASAGDHGYYYHAKVHQHGTLVATPASFGPVVHTTSTHVPISAGVALVAAPAAQVATTHYMVAASVPAYYTYSAGVAPAGPLASLPNTSSAMLQSSQASFAPSMLKSASASASISGSSGQVTADYVTQYNLFLQQENLRNPGTMFGASAGVRTNPADLAAFNQNHPNLTQAVGGGERLGSIGRFLLQKLGDPNFRNNAIKLFEPLLGTFLPQFAPLIDSFLNDLMQGSGNGGNLTPLPVNGSPLGVPSSGGTFNATGTFPGVIVLTPVSGPVPPPAPGPGPVVPLQKLKDDGSGGRVAPSP